MNKKIVLAIVAFALLAGILSYYLAQNNFDNSSATEKKIVILQDDDKYSTINTASSAFSPLVVAGLGLALVASVPVALKILNDHSKKKLKQSEHNKGKDSTF